MSADNWAYCPKCKVAELKKEASLDETIRQSYGKISSEKYLELLQKRQNPVGLECTLREDYNIGIYDGEFYVSYSGSCQKCDFKKAFK